jgi:flagellar assembly factor FliW
LPLRLLKSLIEVGYSIFLRSGGLTVKIKTTRFGELEVDKKDVIEFTEGLLGFENQKKFFIVDPGDQTLILWLQSTDDAGTAFPIIEPKIFQPNYMVKLLPVELNSLALENLQNASVYTVLTIPQNVTEMSANLKAPIIINNKTNTLLTILTMLQTILRERMLQLLQEKMLVQLWFKLQVLLLTKSTHLRQIKNAIAFFNLPLQSI